jgi:rhomboid protease GluP
MVGRLISLERIVAHNLASRLFDCLPAFSKHDIAIRPASPAHASIADDPAVDCGQRHRLGDVVQWCWFMAFKMAFSWRGANFGPATQDGQWWRLGSALFLHFGCFIFLSICLPCGMPANGSSACMAPSLRGDLFAAGLVGNLLSLVIHDGHAVSGGASGAIFGLYGALLSYLWLERQRIHRGEFRWLFWAAIGFSVATIIFGFLVPGIDNAAHIGGLTTGLLMGVLLVKSEEENRVIRRPGQWASAIALVILIGGMVARIPAPAYRWSDEKQVRQEIGEFLQQDAAISRAWESLLLQGRRKGVSFDELADVIESVVVERYEHSFEELSALPQDARLPSAQTAEYLRNYAEQQRTRRGRWWRFAGERSTADSEGAGRSAQVEDREIINGRSV